MPNRDTETMKCGECMERVKVKREKIAIKTYPVGEPEKNPMFFERRVSCLLFGEDENKRR